jgi:hypothetical protein
MALPLGAQSFPGPRRDLQVPVSLSLPAPMR